jgi:hypothetical protein
VKVPLFLKFRVEIYFVIALFLGAIPGTYLYSHIFLSTISDEIKRVAVEQSEKSQGKKDLRFDFSGTSLKFSTTDNDSDKEDETKPKELEAEEKERQALREEHDAKIKSMQDSLNPQVFKSREEIIKEAVPLCDSTEKFIFWAALIFLFLYNVPIRKVLACKSVGPDIRKKAQGRILSLTWTTFILVWFVAIGTEINILSFEWLSFGTIDLNNFAVKTVSTLFFGLVSSALVLI